MVINVLGAIAAIVVLSLGIGDFGYVNYRDILLRDAKLQGYDYTAESLIEDEDFNVLIVSSYQDSFINHEFSENAAESDSVIVKTG